MSQAHGRNSGPRDNGPRHPRRPSNSTPRRENKPFVKGQPARDPAQTASIFKTRSFKLLVDAVGAENIALGLDSNLTRVAELVNGVGFTPETAFHIETTLGLPDGYFDQPNPVLSPEIVTRLKSPLDFIQAHAEPDIAYPDPIKPAAVAAALPPSHSSDRLPKEPEMPKKSSGGSPRADARNTQNTRNTNKPAAKPDVSASPRAAPAKAPVRTSPQQSLLLNDDAAVEKIRRANLHVLTSRNGSKARLGTLMELSGSNMAHRLHGQKRLDDSETNRFTERLGLPVGWLDVPRIPADIPASVAALLLPASRRGGAAQEHVAPASVPAPKLAASSKDGVRRGVRQGKRALPADANQEHVEAVVAAQVRPLASTPQDETAAPSVPLAFWEEPHSAPVEVPARFASPASSPVFDAAQGSGSATSLEDLQGISPIAEALLKTLAGKARTGRLDEIKALEMLQQAILL
jgi:hypothetical protein